MFRSPLREDFFYERYKGFAEFVVTQGVLPFEDCHWYFATCISSSPYASIRKQEPQVAITA